MGGKINILVTGCGGDIGQSIGKILNNCDFIQNLIGCDIHDNHPGKFIYRRCYLVPPCTEEKYFQRVEDLIKHENIDLVLPASEPELRLYSKKGISESIFSRPLIMANQNAMKIGFDKLSTFEFLMNNGLPAPKTFIVSQLDKPDFPLILKSRTGAGSKSLLIINDYDDLGFYRRKYPDYIAQEIVGTDNDEYTCCLFRSVYCVARSIIFKRKLTGGFSGYGEFIENDEISNLLEVIAKVIDLQGSINVQLRMNGKIPYIFEINPRFSSTVLFRHLMGFKDVIWSLEHVLFNKVSEYNPPAKGTKFYKGFNEYVEGNS